MGSIVRYVTSFCPVRDRIISETGFSTHIWRLTALLKLHPCFTVVIVVEKISS